MSYEREYLGLSGGIVAGIDEAGRGPWAGPVVASAVIIDIKNIPNGINDSKKLSKKKREVLFDAIMASCKVGIGIVNERIIDEINILQATLLAMENAVAKLPIKPDILLVDGNRAPNISCKIHTIIKGDSKSISIAGASIIAKVTRDRIMCKLDEEFPKYGWKRNAGYGTREHSEAINKFGITAYHRKSFTPVKKVIKIA